MANRVQPEEVKEIIDTDIDSKAVDSYIRAANITVTSLLSDSDLTDQQLKEIERWLTAHLIACTRQREKDEEAAGDARVSYVAMTAMYGKGLDATLYGQQVKVLVTTGTLATYAGAAVKLPISMYAITSFDDEDV